MIKKIKNHKFNVKCTLKDLKTETKKYFIKTRMIIVTCFTLFAFKALDLLTSTAEIKL